MPNLVYDPSFSSLVAPVNNPTFTGTVTLPNGTVTSGMILDGAIANADISSSAAIAHSKLANTTAGQVLLGTTTTGVVTATTITGDVAITGAGVTSITANSIVDADINTAAAISLSKLATSTAGNIIVYNASGVPTSVAETGDVTISDTGVTAIASNVIVNADINSAAAIALTKLASGTSAQIVLANATGVPTYTSVTGDVTITNAGVTAIGSGVIIDADIANSTITNGKLANTSVTIGSTAIALGSSNTTIAGLTSVTSSNANVSTKLSVTSVSEPMLVSATAATGTIAIDYLSNPSVYYTSNASANWTLNVRGNSTVTMNNSIATGDTATVVFMAQQGATAYYANVVQVDGTTITPKWQGGTAPTSGNASSIDSYALSIIKTAANTYTVLASQTKFA